MPSKLTAAEESSLKAIAEKIRALHEFLNKCEPPAADSSRLDGWFDFLNFAKIILGNFNNDVSFSATLQAKQYLAGKHTGFTFDAAERSQSAPGLDIDVRLAHGKRIVAEVKTVEPYKVDDFGAQQRVTIEKDFAKLAKAVADYKYLFLTAPRAFEVVDAKYRQRLVGVTVVCLTEGKEFIG